MSYHKLLQTVLDLPISYAVDEAPARLGDTIMLVNGELSYVRKINELGIILRYEGGKEVTLTDNKVTSLEVWLPKTGIYSDKNKTGKVVLQRVPYRQWKRSYSPTFYITHFLGRSRFDILDIDVTSRESFGTTPDGLVWYNDIHIGTVNKVGDIICTDLRFEQELSDLLRDFPDAFAIPKATSPRKNSPKSRHTSTHNEEIPF